MAISLWGGCGVNCASFCDASLPLRFCLYSRRRRWLRAELGLCCLGLRLIRLLSYAGGLKWPCGRTT